MRPAPKILKQHISYNPATGELCWIKVFTHRRLHVPIQTQDCYGYIVIKFKGRMYKGHRIAWAVMKGRWPTKDIDHKDGVPWNNKWENLRQATRHQNHANSKLAKNNQCKLKGVHLRGKKYSAAIKVNKCTLYLGTFETPQLAHRAYQIAAKKHFGDFARF